MFKHILSAVFLIVATFPAFAQSFKEKDAVITCKQNPMVEGKQYCSGKIINISGPLSWSNYMFSTTDTGDIPLLTVGYTSISHMTPTSAIFKISDKLVSVNAVAYNASPNCSGSYCVWQANYAITLNDELIKQLSTVDKVMLSYKDGSYISEPVTINSQLIVEWYNRWINIH